MSNHIAGLLAELERLAESGKPQDYCLIMNTDGLSPDEQKAARLMQKVMGNYQAALEYDLMNYKLAFGALSIARWTIDFVDGDLAHPDNKFTVSDEGRRILGYSNELDLPNSMSTFNSQLHPDERDWVLQAVADHVNDRTGQTPYDHEYRIKMKSGEYRYFHTFGSTLRDRNGVPLRLAAALVDITEKKLIQIKTDEADERTQSLLKQLLDEKAKSEELAHWYKSILDAVPLPITVTDANMNWTFVNTAVERFLGTKREEMMGKPCSDWNAHICNTPDCGIVCAKRGQKQTFFRHNDLSFQVDVEILKDLEGETAGFIEVVQDITKIEALAKKQLETEETKNSFNTLKNVLSGLDALIYVTDPRTGVILFINENMIEYYGLESDCVGKLCYKVFHKDKDAQCDFCPCLKLDKEPDKVLIWEEYRPEHDKTHRHSERYIKWPDGSVVHLRHSVDITDIKKATSALDRRLEQQDLMTFVSQSFLLHIMSAEKLHELINDALSKIGEFMDVGLILLYVLEEEKKHFACINEWADPELDFPSLIGREFSLNESETALALFDKMKNREAYYMTSDDPVVREVMGPYRSIFQNYLCTTIYVEDKLYGMLDFSWKNNGRKWSQDDINLAEFFSNVLTGAFYRHMYARQMITAKELAEQGSRSKSIFLASMSHEIRTPLNAILGIAEIQLQEETLSPVLEDSFSKIYEAGDLLLSIINDILDHSKIEAGKLEILPVRYDMPSLLNDAVQLIRLRYESKPLDFQLHVEENTPLDLFGDELRIKQVLSNLLSNAFKYTEEGMVSLSVAAEPAQHTETPDTDPEGLSDVTLIFTVRDTGQGMTKEQLSRLFDEYTRFNLQTNRSTVGTGLGMNITKRFVELMDGEILVESESGKGTVSTIRLPQKRIGFAVCGSELGSSLQIKNTVKTHKTQIIREYMPYGSVLVVDDVESNLHVAKGLLSSYGLKIETVSSGFEAIELVRRGNIYDIVFMDHMMPRMDGMEATRLIRGMGYTGSVVALTANAVAGQAEMFLANGFDRFISKPVDIRELNAVLNDLIRNKQPPEVIEAARQTKKEIAGLEQKPDNISDDLVKAFLRDACSTVSVLEEQYDILKAGGDADIQSYFISVHGIKNALLHLGEYKLSSAALKLEQAGRDRNTAVMLDETPTFVRLLRAVMQSIKPEDTDIDADCLNEDKEFLCEKMEIIKSACGEYDKKAAKTALEELRQKPWSSRTKETLDAIAVHLLHGTFEEAAGMAEDVLAVK